MERARLSVAPIDLHLSSRMLVEASAFVTETQRQRLRRSRRLTGAMNYRPSWRDGGGDGGSGESDGDGEARPSGWLPLISPGSAPVGGHVMYHPNPGELFAPLSFPRMATSFPFVFTDVSIDPIVMTVNVNFSASFFPRVREPYRTLLTVIGNVSELPVRLARLRVADERLPPHLFGGVVRSWYRNELYAAAYALFWSGDVIGNPIGLLSDINKGLYASYHAPLSLTLSVSAVLVCLCACGVRVPVCLCVCVCACVPVCVCGFFSQGI